MRLQATCHAIAFSILFAAHLPSLAQCHTTLLINGKITTMSSAQPSASWMLIDGERIAALGSGKPPQLSHSCGVVIDLAHHRVIPGLIDSHNHIVVQSLRPGYDVRLDIAASVQEAMTMLNERSHGIPATAWITSIGGWSPEQFAEHRMPSLSELDAAAPGHPVYLQIGFDGPAVTNSLGRAFLKDRGVSVADDGSIAVNEPTVAAYNSLRSLQTPADKLRGAVDAMNFAASVGLTTSDDKGGTWPTDMEGTKDAAEVGDKTNVLNPFTDYNAFLALDRDGRMAMRLRIFFYMQDRTADLPFLRARLNNQFPDFGDNWLKVSGIGERIYSGPFPFTPGSSPDTYIAAARMIAEHGWAHDEHAQGLKDEKEFASAWEKVNAQIPLAPLRWCLAHVPGIDNDTLQRLKALGVGVSLAGSRYTASDPPRISPKDIPPFRRIVDSGIQVGYGSDGGTVSAIDPWAHMYYMVTGKNSAGQMVAPEQTLTRIEALRLYTVNQPWFTGDERDLGSLDVGKLADLVVLNADFLDPAQVDDNRIKRIKSVLTIVGGKIVYDTHTLTARK